MVPNGQVPRDKRSHQLFLPERWKALRVEAKPSTNGSHSPTNRIEAKGAASIGAAFWPHNADRPLADIEPVGQKRILLASYVLYSVLRHRALKLTEAPVFVGREDENGEFESVPHELDDLFREPNPDQDWQDVSTVTQQLLDLDGQALWLRSTDRAERTRAIDVYHEGEYSVFPARGEDGEPARMYGRFSVNVVPNATNLGPDDVVYWRTPHPYDRYETTSPTDAVAHMLGIGSDLRTRVRGMIRNAAAPGGFFVRPPDLPRMGDEEFKASRDRLRSEFSSVRSGSVGLLEGGMTFEQIGWNLADVEFGPLWREIEAAVCAAFGVRPEILGFMVGLENAPWSHMATARRLEYEDAHIPMWRTWERTLTRQLLSREERTAGLQVKFDLTQIPALQEDRDLMSKVARRMWTDLSRNERRKLVGFEATDRPEDDEVQEAPEPPRGIGGTGEEGMDGEREERGRLGRFETKHRLTEEEKAAAWKAFDDFARGEEETWEDGVLPLLDGDREWALEWFEDGVKGWYRLEEKQDLEARIRRLMAELQERYGIERLPVWEITVGSLVADTARAAGRRAAETLGTAWDLMIPGVDRYAERHAAELVTQVGRTTKERIRSALARGLREGEDIPTIAGRIRESGAFSESRATLIARTEATTTTNGSQVEGLQHYARTSGNQVRKTWLATRDDRTRDEHRAMDGREVGIQELFNTPDLGPIEGPGAPNCRCTLTYRLVREGEE